MATEQLLSNVTQAQYDAAEQTLIDAVRAAYPSLDLRRGTVIRDLLIRPAAAKDGVNTANQTILANKMSLVTLQQDSTATNDDYNAILANLGTSLGTGTLASGQALITVSDAREYDIGANFIFTDLTGRQYQTIQAYTVVLGATGTDLPLYSNTDGTYYFILPLVAVEVGTSGNIAQGTALTPTGTLFAFISADAYANFSGGQDAETITAALQRLPASISYRALESATSIDAKLREAFAGSTVAIQTMSVAGYGHPAQLRDKHNPMGFAVGSRVDVYARTYTSPRVITLKKTGKQIGPTSYQFTIDASDAPGFSLIRSVSEVEAVITPTLAFGTLVVVGSYPFTEVRSAVANVFNAGHDVDSANSMVETAYSTYQQATVIVTNVAGGTSTHDFKVELYAPNGIADLQAYVDDASVRNVEADYVIRSPLMCMVELKATVYCSKLNPVTADTFKSVLVDYINARSFVKQLTRSELVNILLSSGAQRVDLSSTGMQMFGAVRDAAGVIHFMSGDSLSIEDVSAPTALLTYQTCVFATEASQLQIEVITE